MSGTFLSRWARRKEAVRAAEQSELPVAPLAAETGEAPSTAPPDEAARAAAEAGAGSPPETAPDDLLASLPSLDALTPETDLTAFLQAGVPTALRNAALRRMWSLDPAIRDFVSEAREYAYDWNTPGGVPGMGPLLPTDDVKAMLKRIVDGVPVPDAEEPCPDPQEVATTLQEDPAHPAVGDGPEPEALSRSEDPRLEEGIPPMAETPVQAADPVDHRETAQSPPFPRLRRHGGAMPT
jgi:hypothetical protein